MSKKKLARAGVAGLLFVCALVGTSSMTTQADTVTSTITVGSQPWGVAINPAGTFAYVANSGSGTVSKIDLATDTVVATITVGSSPMDVAINPAGTFAYIANSGSGTVSKIDLATDTVVGTFSTFGGNPGNVAIDPVGIFVYATSGSNFLKINLASAATSPISGSNPQGVAINPAGTLAYVANSTSGTVSVINTFSDESTSMRVVATITVGAEPTGVAIDRVGTFAYVTNQRAGTVSKIDLTSNTVVATITLSRAGQTGVAINPAGTFAYVNNRLDDSVSKINLDTNTVHTTFDTGTYPRGIAINPAGTFAYVANSGSGTVSKISLTADSQSITFTPLSTQLLGAKTVALSVTASSTLAVVTTSATPAVCTVSGTTVTMLTTGECTITTNQSGGSGWDAAPEVSQTFTILPSPPAGEVGVSIRNGDSYSNSKQVTLNLVWPAYATAARISNDGGFAASKTETKELAASIDWELDDSVKGVYTKVVYVRFNGVADSTKTYSDDIILDTTAPTIDSSTVSVAPSSIKLVVKATDDITGVDKIELTSGSTTVTEDYSTSLLVPVKDLGLAVSTASVKKFGTTSVAIRVSDKAGNWSPLQSLKLPSSVTTAKVTMPKLTKSKSATAKSIAIYAKLKVLSTSKVSLKVARTSAKYCKVVETKLKGLKVGSCKVKVTVTPKKGPAKFKTVTVRVTK